MPDAAGDSHHHADHSALHLDVGSAQAQAKGSSTDPGGSATHDLHKASQSKCSACVSCCASAVLPMALLKFDSPALAEFFAPPMPCLVAVFMTDGQERPPRTFLA